MMSGRSAGAGGDSRHGYVLLLRCWGRGGTGGLCGQWLCGVQTADGGDGSRVEQRVSPVCLPVHRTSPRAVCAPT